MKFKGMGRVFEAQVLSFDFVVGLNKNFTKIEEN